MIWIDDSVCFSYGKDGSGVLPNCSLCGTEATLFYSTGPVRSNFSTEACAILQPSRWSRQDQQFFSHLLLLSDSLSVLVTLSSPFCSISASLAHLTGTILSLPSFLIRLQWVPNHSFFSGRPNNMTDELAILGVVQLSTVPFSLSSLVFLYFFSQTGWIFFCQNSLTNKSPQHLPSNL